jgi:hypothetical protein
MEDVCVYCESGRTRAGGICNEIVTKYPSMLIESMEGHEDERC